MGLPQPLPGDFQSNDVTSSSLTAITFHVTATSCELQPCRGSNVRKTRVLGLLQPLQVTSGEMTSLPNASFPVTRLPTLASYSPVGAQTYTKPEY